MTAVRGASQLHPAPTPVHTQSADPVEAGHGRMLLAKRARQAVDKATDHMQEASAIPLHQPMKRRRL
eukprot:CAMPEP_0171117178 /NCGR_PEP_ID=MMETSP0766_2-20121228/91902_1 /TAXON_ID=439317 /ORGANISM="Gambierdiscus australes, Strain CAWD 149" /LENGTH=66 /DNA_ID=CAMNT_0011579673 /DNA_START=67 /DNA_END=267 /DNA_ORIENTATION=-